MSTFVCSDGSVDLESNGLNKFDTDIICHHECEKCDCIKEGACPLGCPILPFRKLDDVEIRNVFGGPF